MLNNIFIQKDTVNWSLLTSGLNIKTEARSLFHLQMQEMLQHGTNKEICVRINGEDFKAKLKNINFNQNRWEGHRDLIQIRYSAGSPLARKLQSIFSAAFQYISEKRADPQNAHTYIRLPEHIQEYYVLCATEEPYVFEMNCFSIADTQHLTNTLPYFTEEEFENPENDQIISERIAHMTDPGASIEESQRIVKIRKVDRSIIDNLKYIYDYRCQITNEKIGDRFGKSVIEAHHIQYFTQSQNNDAQNIIILSPNYHRIIHRNNPHFNRQTKCFEFENGEKLGLKLNKHL